MTRNRVRISRMVFGAALAAALGYGATEALAAPAANPAHPGLCPFQCNSYCRYTAGYSGGQCLQGYCICY